MYFLMAFIVENSFFTIFTLLPFSIIPYILEINKVENYSKKCYGIQLGVINHCFAGDKIEKQNERVQFLGVNIADFLFVGLVNFSNEIQVGLCNFSKGAVFQVGLINYNPCSYVPWMPIVNFNMGRQSGK